MEERILQLLRKPTEEERRLLAGEPLRREEYTLSAVFEVDSGKLLPARQLITIRKHTRFADFPMHTHNYVEIMYMLSGQTVHLMDNGDEVTLRAGELLLFNRRAAHAIRRAEESDLAVNFIVEPPFFDVALEMIGTNNLIGGFLLDALRSGEPTLPYLHFRVAEVLPIQSVVESMVYTLLSPSLSSRRIDQTAMGLLFMHLLRHTETIGVSSGAKRAHILVMDALREIQEHYATADFTALSAERGVSLAYLSRLVKQATGESCTELLQKRRMQKAQQLLRSTALPITEVSRLVGYENTTYFYRVYRALMGTSPMDERKASLAKQ